MADIEKSTRLARLLVAPPSFVYDELKAYSAEVRSDAWSNDTKELEAKLAARNDPLIDLAIASFGASEEQIAQLYDKAKLPPASEDDSAYKQGLRLAVLGNETVGSRSFLNRFPTDVIGEAEVAAVLKDGDWIEAQTLIENPTVSDDILLAVYRGDTVADGLSDERRRQLVAISGRNPRLQDRNDDEFGPDLGHYNLHNAIFRMLETVPTSDAWLECLSYLLLQIDPSQAAHPDSIDDVLERWTVGEQGNTPEQSKADGDHTALDRRTEFRCLIASLYARRWNRNNAVHGSPEDEDVVRRCAYYGKANLDPKQIKGGYEKDGDVFVFAAMANDDVFTKRANRKLFEEECLTGRHFHRYRRRCEQIHSQWSNFDPRPMAEWMIEKSEEQPSPEAKLEAEIAQLGSRLSSIEKSLTYVFWLIVVAALAIMWRR